MKNKKKKKATKPKTKYSKKENGPMISEFEIVNPTQEGEVAGEKLPLTVLGEYGHRGYNLIFLLDHPSHYRISKVIMNGYQYIIPADRKKNWLPTLESRNHKFIVP